jgi:hypothetical protein
MRRSFVDSCPDILRQRYIVGPLTVLLDKLNHLVFYLLRSPDHVLLEQLKPTTNPRNDTRNWVWECPVSTDCLCCVVRVLNRRTSCS